MSDIISETSEQPEAYSEDPRIDMMIKKIMKTAPGHLNEKGKLEGDFNTLQEVQNKISSIEMRSKALLHPTNTDQKPVEFVNQFRLEAVQAIDGKFPQFQDEIKNMINSIDSFSAVKDQIQWSEKKD